MSLLADSDRPRERRSIAGERMVEPVQPFTVNGEQLRPGRDRFSPDHDWVLQRPELFRPAMPGDKWTSDRMRALYQRAERQLLEEGTTRTVRRRDHTAGSLRLPGPKPPLRLP